MKSTEYIKKVKFILQNEYLHTFKILIKDIYTEES